MSLFSAVAPSVALCGVLLVRNQCMSKRKTHVPGTSLELQAFQGDPRMRSREPEIFISVAANAEVSVVPRADEVNFSLGCKAKLPTGCNQQTEQNFPPHSSSR